MKKIERHKRSNFQIRKIIIIFLLNQNLKAAQIIIILNFITTALQFIHFII